MVVEQLEAPVILQPEVIVTQGFTVRDIQPDYTIVDRILSINMAGTMIITAIVFMSGIQEETSLIDIGLLYAMISFLAVVVFSRIYRGEYLSLKDKKRKEMAAQEHRATEEGLHSDGDD